MKCVGLLSLIAVSTLVSPAISQTVYRIVPRDLDDGYRIAGGTITADESLTRITDWNVEVTGDEPYIFSNENPGAFVDDGGFEFTDSQIIFSPSSLESPSARFAALDNTTEECTDCLQSLIWTQLTPGVASFVVFVQSDRLDQTPSLSPDALLLHDDMVVATAVPEPLGSTLLLWGVLFLSIARAP